MRKYSKLYVYSDGSARPNPGNAAIAFTIYDENGRIVAENSKAIGITTNNVAEYKALLAALKEASKYSKDDIFCFSDSELLIKQLNGEDKVKAKHLKKMFEEVNQQAKKFKTITYDHRQENTDPRISRVDELAKEKTKIQKSLNFHTHRHTVRQRN